jgi:hypothetical protein
MRAALTSVVVALSLSPWGCSKPPTLTGAKAPIPVYPSSRLDMRDDPFGGFHTDGPKSYLDGTYWYLATRDSPEKVELFYRQALPSVDPTEVQMEGGKHLRFRWTPEGMKQDYGEEISVEVPLEKKDGITRLRIQQLVIQFNH